MRRFLSCVVLFSLCLQSSGASAATGAASSIQSSVPTSTRFAWMIANLSGYAQSTMIGAALTGNYDAWRTMHAPPPMRVAPLSPESKFLPVLPDVRRLPRRIRAGNVISPPIVRNNSYDPLRAPLDPTAMKPPTRSPIPPTRYARESVSGSGVHTMGLTTITNNSSTTGINHWWTYEEGPITGVGKWMTNVANGNVVMQVNDADVPEAGIDLAFRRTWNSQSQHDHLNTDGSGASVFGDGWTNTFDAHIAFYNSNATLSVYDIDGARYDYTSDGNGGWIHPPGMFNTLTTYDSCHYAWTKKTGTTYVFYRPDVSTIPACNAGAGFNGRTAMIQGRHHNATLTFTYSWANNDSSTIQNLTKLQVVHSDGHSMTLNFTQAVNGGSYTELTSIVLPDTTTTTTYYYDATYPWKLTEIDHPGNGSNGGAALPEMYTWNGNDEIHDVESPRYVLSYRATGGAPTDGAFTRFSYNTSQQVTTIANRAVDNFTPDDNAITRTQLQPGTTGTTFSNPISYETFTYSPTTACNNGVVPAPCTTGTDTYGHSSVWGADASGRVTETQIWTDAPSNLWLTTGATWDSQNDLKQSVDPRGFTTDYAYDMSGNTTAVALPSVPTYNATYRPTQLFSYDAHNNVVQACDAVFTHSLTKDWTADPGTSDSLCPAQTGASQYTYDFSDSNEPYGRLATAVSPTGYVRTISYTTSGTQYGLPTNIQGTSITQWDNSSRIPRTIIDYDAYGNVACYSNQQDTGGQHFFRATYDSLNRRTATADPDDWSLAVSQCTNTAGIANSHIQSTTNYFPNGAVASTQSPSEYAASVQYGTTIQTTYGYDADGNEISQTDHAACSSACTNPATRKWYDGDDRLVEVQQPQDSTNDYYHTTTTNYTYPWMTRYIYDLTQGSNVSINGVSASFRAYGNLYKTQEYIPSTPTVVVATGPSSPTWTDVRGTSFDAVDRALASYEVAFGTTAKLTNTYDTSGNTGLLSQTQNAASQQSTLTYYSTGWVNQKTFSDTTPSMTYTYDGDGRTKYRQSSTFGQETLVYDPDGHVTSDAEPSASSNYTSPATITYDYYDDGTRKDLSVTSSGLSQTYLFKYSYRTDGALKEQDVNGTRSGAFTWTYTPAGRELTQSDPFTNNRIELYRDSQGIEIDTGQSRTLQARTLTYDTYGRNASLILPEGYTYSAFTYDDEGETTGYSRSNAYCQSGNLTNTTCAGPRSQTYTVRRELTSVGDADVAAQSGNGPLANGTPIAQGLLSYDARSGMVTGKRTYVYTNNKQQAYGSVDYAYDAAGRQTTVTDNYSQSYLDQYGNMHTTNYSGVATRGYDAENHLVKQAYTGDAFMCPDSLTMCAGQQVGGASGVSSGGTVTYQWGPNGHPLLSGWQAAGATQPTYGTAHWDGDDVLFSTTTTSSTLVYIGKLGLGGAGGPSMVVDRDMSGQQVATHSATAFGAWSSQAPGKTWTCTQCKAQGDTPTFFSGTIASAPDSYSPPVPLFDMGREDGYGDSWGNTFQGVRAYDPNAGQWTSPDVYAGRLHDPMSQKPFMWNGSNPLEYEDPSGYYRCDDCTAEEQQVLDDTAKGSTRK